MSKIKTIADLKKIVTNLRREGKKVVLTNGCFDILHIGHVRYLKNAKKIGNILVVGVNGDESTRIIKGQGRPIIPEQERAEILSALECVDYVIIFQETRPENLIRQLRPAVHVKGSNYTAGRLLESKLVKSIGGRTVILKGASGKSTRSIIKKILKAYG